MYEKIKKIKVYILIFIILIGFGGLVLTSRDTDKKDSKPTLSMQIIKDDIKKGSLLIDVRTPEEYSSGHIDGAVNLDSEDIKSGQEPEVSKDKTIYLYCRSGNRSAQSAKSLKAAGFSKVVDLGAMTHVQSIGGLIIK